MKFLLDHDVPDDLSYQLIQLGHEVVLLRQVLRADRRPKLIPLFGRAKETSKSGGPISDCRRRACPLAFATLRGVNC